MTLTYAKRLRIDRGEGITHVAKAAGISTVTLNKVEAGNEVGTEALARLAAYYSVKPSSLLPGQSEPDPAPRAAA
jgi:transcriptional regulator with XRE-family HTH domain